MPKLILANTHIHNIPIILFFFCAQNVPFHTQDWQINHSLITLWQLPWQLWTLWLAVQRLEGWELHPLTGKARRENVPLYTAEKEKRERERERGREGERDGLDTPLLPLGGGWGGGEQQGGWRDRGTDGWMEGLPLLRFSGGPCFLPVRTEREGGMLIRWLKGKIKIKTNWGRTQSSNW